MFIRYAYFLLSKSADMFMRTLKIVLYFLFDSFMYFAFHLSGCCILLLSERHPCLAKCVHISFIARKFFDQKITSLSLARNK